MKIKSSIRFKLMSAIFLLIAVAISSICIYIYTWKSKDYVNKELEYQSSLSKMLSTTLSGTYYTYIERQINFVQYNRKIMKNKIRTITNLVKFIDSKNKSGRMINYKFLEALKKDNYEFIVYDKKLGVLEYYCPVERGRLTGLQQTNLSEILQKEEIPKDGFFFSMNDKNGKYYLIYALKDKNSDYVYALIEDISIMREYYDKSYDELTRSLQSNITGLEKTWDGSVVVFDDNNNIIIQGNKGLNLIPYLTHDDLENAKDNLEENSNSIYTGKAFINNDTSIDDHYISISYFKPLNWYILTARDEYSIMKSVHSMLYTIISIGLIVSIIAMFIAWLLLSRITESLRKLSRKAIRLSTCDFTNLDSVKAITDTMKTQSQDEVGNLSDALVSMSLGLQQNLMNLIDINSKQKRIEGELSAASDIQMGMLPDTNDLPKSDIFDVYAVLEPAKEVGGDLYDAFMLDENRLVFCIGDVSDKGMPAALFMSTIATLVRLTMSDNMEPKEAVSKINTILSERNPKIMFVTLVLGVLNVKTGDYTICNAGHCPPYLIDCKTNQFTKLDEICGPSVAVIGGVDYTDYKGVMPSNSTLFLYTDGVTEAQNEDGKFFEEQRIEKQISNGTHECAKDLTENMLNDVIEFRKNAAQSDDITIMSIHRV